LVAAIIASALMGRRRSLLADAARFSATLDPPLQVHGNLPVPLPNKLLIIFNHYTHPGAPVWWTAFALGGALVRLGLTRPEPRWVMTAAWTHLGALTPISRWVLHRLAMTYAAFSMPPMPPDPHDVEARAAAVRQVLAFARSCADARVCLAPEGRASSDGCLIAPPPGTGRFILQLGHLGMIILPAGVCDDGGVWRVRFGEALALEAPEGLPPEARDEWAARRVMRAIGELLPERLRAWP